jgi:hypothetical protein
MRRKKGKKEKGDKSNYFFRRNAAGAFMPLSAEGGGRPVL